MSQRRTIRKNVIQRLEQLECREVPAVTNFIGVGADAGSAPQVRLLQGRSHVERLNFTAYNPNFLGGVRVAVGDVTGDGVDDLVTAPATAGGPHVKVFDGTNGKLVREIFAYNSAFNGGMSIAVADVNIDGVADIITGAGAGGGPHVRVFDGVTNKVLREFFAFDASFTGGVNVAAGDVNGDGRADIIVGAGAGGGPHVRVFSGATGKQISEFFAYDAGFRGGVNVSTGIAPGSSTGQVITGPAGGGSAHIKLFDGVTGILASQFFSNFGANYSGGARIASGFVNEDNRLDLIVAPGTGNAAMNVHDAGNGAVIQSIAPFNGVNSDGAFVSAPSLQDSNTVIDFNNAALQAIRNNKTNPPVASRALAILHVAIEDAIHTVETSLNSDVLSIEAAAAAAGHRVLTTFFPNQTAKFDALLNGAIALVPDGGGESTSVGIGQKAADAIIAERSNDGSTAVVTYTPTNQPGHWQPTPPANAPFLVPQWGNVTPFVLNNGDQFLPPAPPDLTTQKWADDYTDVKALGSLNSATRTADQTQIALFWADGGGTITPPGHWNRIASTLARSYGLSNSGTARVLSALNQATADAAITSWRAKLLYDFWRPVTAIRAGDTDNNANTDIDATWTSLITTPPFPDHTSGHSTFSGAAATVLSGLFGDNVAFTTYSDDLTDVSRGFANFQVAADEAGRSRIYGGIHYESANQNGLASGRAIGQFVLQSL